MKLSELTKDHSIICRSEQEWQRIAKLLHESGRTWGSGDAYWPPLFDWQDDWQESPMAFCLDGTYFDNEAEFSDSVVESTDIEDELEEILKDDSQLFQVGDKCWSPTYGHGKVVEINNLVKVNFGEPGTWFYQFDGREDRESPQPTLFHQEVKEWPCPPRLPPLPELNVDDKVYVDISGAWEARHFSHWVVDNRIYMGVFVDGRTSHTTLCGTHLYARWRIAD